VIWPHREIPRKVAKLNRILVLLATAVNPGVSFASSSLVLYIRARWWSRQSPLGSEASPIPKSARCTTSSSMVEHFRVPHEHISAGQI
jgi:hypothetical protein